MKHEKEWYTCDRCGRELIPPSTFRHIIPHKENKVFAMKFETVEKEAYISDYMNTMPTTDSCTITFVGDYRMRNKEIHLCRNCRERFERSLERARENDN